jgi:hypothetical protein
MTGLEEIQKAKEAGFSDDEIASGLTVERQKAIDAGFSPQDFDEYYGKKSFDPKPIQDHVSANIQKATAPETPDGKPKQVKDFAEAFEAGFGISTGSLLFRPPTKELSPDAPMLSRFAANAGTFLGDIPALTGGYLIGGANPITGTAGAIAFDEGLRKIMMDKYEKGEVQSFQDFFERAGGATLETLKGWVTGAVLGGVGQGMKLAPIASPAVKNAATYAAEVATLATIAPAMNGHFPEPEDFADAALFLGFVKGSGMIAGKLRHVYAKTGVKPDQVVQDALTDPTILQDLASDRPIPKTYEDRLADRLAQERAVQRGVERRPTGEYVDVKSVPSITELAGKAITPEVPGASPAGAFYGTGQPPSARVTPPYMERPSFLPSAQGLVSGKADLQKSLEDEVKNQEKPRALRSAEEILQERNILKSAEDMISREPRPKLREKVYILPKGRGPVIESNDMAEITKELEKSGIVIGEEGKPSWQENVPIKEAEQAVLDRVVQQDPKQKKLTLSALYTSVMDNLHPIKKAVAESGVMLETAKDPYQLERLTRGVMSKGTQFIERGAFDFDTYETTTKGYKQILDPVKDDLDGFRSYIVSKRAVERHGKGFETGIPLPEAETVVREGKGKYEKVFQERLKFIDARLDYLVKSGIVGSDKAHVIREASQEYVPMYKFFEEQESGRPSAARDVRNPLKKMKGGDEKILDPIVSDIKDTFLFIGLAEKNAARQAYVALGPEFAEKIRTKSDPVTKKDIADIVEQFGVTEKAAEAISEISPKSFRAQKNEMVVFENGKREVYKVDPDVAEAFGDADRVASGFLANIIHAPAVLLRAGVTITPDFIARNIIRDAVSSFIFAGSNPIKTIKGAKSILTKDTAFQNWMKGGGGNATMVAMDRAYIDKHLIELNTQTGLMERSFNVAKKPLDVLHAISELVENSTRLGTVRDPMLQAKNKATIQALSMIAREATVDFARHGKDLQEFGKMTAFFNPALQGIDRFGRAMKDAPLATTTKAVASVTIPSLILSWVNKNDEEIQNLPQWQKDLFWVARIPLPGEGSFLLRIPKAHEVGVLFGSLPERLFDKFFNDNPNAFKNFEDTMLNAFLPAMIPTAAVPIVSQFANRNTFSGGSIIPYYLEKLMPEYQYTEYTTETAKAIGGLIGAFPGMTELALSDKEPALGGVARALTTPALIENYVRAWSGGMGMYIFNMADLALRKTGVLPDPVLPASTLADIPVIKAFVVRYPSAQAQSIQDFYDSFAYQKRVFDTFMLKAKEGDIAAMKRVQDFDPSAIAQLDDMRASLTIQGQTIRLISKNPAYSASDKRQLIDQMYYGMIQTSKLGNTMLQRIDKAIGQK